MAFLIIKRCGSTHTIGRIVKPNFLINWSWSGRIKTNFRSHNFKEKSLNDCWNVLKFSPQNWQQFRWEKCFYVVSRTHCSERIFHCKVIEKGNFYPPVQELWKLSLKCNNFDVTLLRTIADILIKYVVLNKNLPLI